MIAEVVRTKGNRLHHPFYLALAVMAGYLPAGCRSNAIDLGMSKENLVAKVGPPKRVEVLADGREEWFYDVETKANRRENFSNPNRYHYPGTAEGAGFLWPGEESTSGIEFSADYTTTERPVSISPDGKIEGIPNGKIIENR